MGERVQRCELPPGALLRTYQAKQAYTDCYCTEVAQVVSQAQYVEAFYTTAVFRLERLLLRLFASRPSTDAQARALASGAAHTFAAWHVEARAAGQLLVCDFSGRTRSWLMVAAGPGADSTRLYFGSAVVPAVSRRSGRPELGGWFRALLGFHRLYSRVLLSAARRRLIRG